MVLFLLEYHINHKLDGELDISIPLKSAISEIHHWVELLGVLTSPNTKITEKHAPYLLDCSRKGIEVLVLIKF